MTIRSSGERDEGKDSDQSPDGSGPKNAFALATGYVFQSVGLLFTFGVCSFWSLTTYFLPPGANSGAHWMDDFGGDRLSAALVTIGAAATIVGGMGLVGAGIGLQGERPSGGTVANLVTGLLSLVYWFICFLYGFWTESWVGTLVSGGFALVATVLLALAVHSAKILRESPPLRRWNVVTDEFLEQMRSERHHLD